jgi:uncharacterized protein YqjF (DUF2071 family)
MASGTGPRPPRRPWHAFTWLDHLAIVTFTVDAERLDDLLPPGFVAERFDDDDARPTGLVSAVSCLDRNFHFRGCPPVTMTAGQIDYRTYVVHDDGERGVWFFGASLDSPLGRVARHLWSMPWHRERITIEADWDGDTLASMRVAARGHWCDADVELVDGATTSATMPASVTDPLVGWYARRGRPVRRYRVWHEPLDARPVTARVARYQVFEELGLVERGQAPRSALVQRELALDVETPPRRLSPTPHQL